MLKYEPGISSKALPLLERIRAYNDHYYIAFADHGQQIQVFDKDFTLIDAVNLNSRANDGGVLQ